MNHDKPLTRTIRYSQVIDLSHTIDPDIPLWPGDPPIRFETVANLATDGYYLRQFSMGEHSATHINAPNSFHASAPGIDDFEAQSLVLPAIVIDIRPQTRTNPDYALNEDDVLAWEARHGRIQAGNLVLVNTGWDEKWDMPRDFLNPDSDGSLHFPGIGTDAANLLLFERRIAGAGIDTHGIDPGQDRTFATNTLLLSRRCIVLENLTRLDQLPPLGTTVVIGILRLRAASGSPVSVLALAP